MHKSRKLITEEQDIVEEALNNLVDRVPKRIIAQKRLKRKYSNSLSQKLGQLRKSRSDSAA